MKKLLEINRDEWLEEVESIKEYYKKYGDKLPKELENQLIDLENRLRG